MRRRFLTERTVHSKKLRKGEDLDMAGAAGLGSQVSRYIYVSDGVVRVVGDKHGKEAGF